MTLPNPPKSEENLAGQISGSAAEIHIENLTKKFGDFVALNNFSINKKIVQTEANTIKIDLVGFIIFLFQGYDLLKISG